MADKPEKIRALDNPIMRAAMDHFKPNELRTMVIPQWIDPDGEAYRIYWYPWTLEDQSWLNQQGGIDGMGLEAYADLIIKKCLDEHGNKLFALGTRKILLEKVDPAVIISLVNFITAARSRDDHLKN